MPTAAPWSRRRASGAVTRAGRCVFWLTYAHMMHGEVAQGSGWLARGQRLLDEHGLDCAERGYALAGIAFIGGSLVKRGGQNPIEAAAAGCAVMFGSDMSDFPDVAAGLLQANAARVVQDQQAMEAAVDAWLVAESNRLAAGLRGREWVRTQGGALQAICQEILERLRSAAA